MRLAYNRRGWFLVWEWLAGVFDFRTKAVLPDTRGLIGKQRLLFGPFDSAAAAMRASRG